MNNQTGFLTPVGDSKVLAAMLDKVMEMPKEEQAKISKQAIESVRTNFSIQKMCDRTIAMYKEILGNELDYKK